MAVVASIFTPEQETRVRDLAAAAIQTWLDTPLPGSKDRDGKTFTPRQAMHRGVWAYDQVRDGGYSEGRIDKLEAAETADDADDAAAAARVGLIEDALHKPILDRPAP